MYIGALLEGLAQCSNKSHIIYLSHTKHAQKYITAIKEGRIYVRSSCYINSPAVQLKICPGALFKFVYDLSIHYKIEQIITPAMSDV